ncbi:hypothetical protein [Aurantimonas sp. VKM B-3413]|uniref:hypothetical protein n=1 Tax=Aurantimonas sp. VKM B-3413 TaxID=2779401 RepID=UPI001E516EE1|nr:hypothetical protein [Aurantimonas sp. VKM B-3413]MCB8837486.1 hypothetical protein [Aurantimonas sp. VKM B-3413]
MAVLWSSAYASARPLTAAVVFDDRSSDGLSADSRIVLRGRDAFVLQLQTEPANTAFEETAFTGIHVPVVGAMDEPGTIGQSSEALAEVLRSQGSVAIDFVIRYHVAAVLESASDEAEDSDAPVLKIAFAASAFDVSAGKGLGEETAELIFAPNACSLTDETCFVHDASGRVGKVARSAAVQLAQKIAAHLAEGYGSETGSAAGQPEPGLVAVRSEGTEQGQRSEIETDEACRSGARYFRLAFIRFELAHQGHIEDAIANWKCTQAFAIVEAGNIQTDYVLRTTASQSQVIRNLRKLTAELGLRAVPTTGDTPNELILRAN